MKKKITIIKSSGEQAEFDESKLYNSLKHSGASDEIILQILGIVNETLHDGMTTKEIYTSAFDYLRKSTPSVAGRYKLKKAILEFGPTGFPFEHYVGKILRHEGFKTKVGVMVKGHCVNHEIDVEAEKGDKHFMVECKFHNDQRNHCNVKIPLYIHSRFQDVEKNWVKLHGHGKKFHQGWIVTNTRFTDDALQFGNCVGIMLVSWNYPQGQSLKERIDRLGLHPITCLSTLTKNEKKSLLTKGKVLCMDICEEPEILTSIGIKGKRKETIVKEAHSICSADKTKIIT